MVKYPLKQLNNDNKDLVVGVLILHFYWIVPQQNELKLTAHLPLEPEPPLMHGPGEIRITDATIIGQREYQLLLPGTNGMMISLK